MSDNRIHIPMGLHLANWAADLTGPPIYYIP